MNWVRLVMSTIYSAVPMDLRMANVLFRDEPEDEDEDERMKRRTATKKMRTKRTEMDKSNRATQLRHAFSFSYRKNV